MLKCFKLKLSESENFVNLFFVKGFYVWVCVWFVINVFLSGVWVFDVNFKFI